MIAISSPPAVVCPTLGADRPKIPSTVQVDAATLGVRTGKSFLPTPQTPLVQPAGLFRAHLGFDNWAEKSLERWTTGTATVERADGNGLEFHTSFRADLHPSFSLTQDDQGVIWLESCVVSGVMDVAKHRLHHALSAIQPLPSANPQERVFAIPSFWEVDEDDNEKKRLEWEAQQERAKHPGEPAAPAHQEAPRMKFHKAGHLTVSYPPNSIIVKYNDYTFTLAPLPPDAASK